MENSGSKNKSLTSAKIDFDDPDYFVKVKMSIEKELAEMKKVVDNMSQMRVDLAYLESDLMTSVSAQTWTQISQLIGLTMHEVVDTFRYE